jgi:hypothetical protein
VRRRRSAADPSTVTPAPWASRCRRRGSSFGCRLVADAWVAGCAGQRACGTLYGVFFAIELSYFKSNQWIPWTFLVCIVIYVVIYGYLASSPLRELREPIFGRSRIYRPIAAAMLFGVLFVVALFVSRNVGISAAAEVEAGRPVTRVGTLYGFAWSGGIFNFRAPCVTLIRARSANQIRNSNSQALWTPPDRAIYLGQANGTLVIHRAVRDRSSGGLIRVNASDFAISESSISECR